MVSLLAAAGAAQGQSFNLVGIAPGTLDSRVYALSSDGRTAAGYSLGASNTIWPGFTWTTQSGRVDWGLAPQYLPQTQTQGLSGDGTTSVGAWSQNGQRRAFRYRTDSGGGGGALDLLNPSVNYQSSAAYGASNDGSLVVGKSSSGQFDQVSQATIWTNSGAQGLGWTQADGVKSEARAISRDGSTVVGYSQDTGGFTQAFAWTSSGGTLALQSPLGLPSNGANGINGDGRFIVGYSGSSTTPILGTIWRDGVPSRLPAVAGSAGWGAYAVSDDGNVVVGTAGSVFPNFAVIWTPSTGTVRLDSYLATFDITVPAGWALEECRTVSSDGAVLGGWAYSASLNRYEGFVATIPAPGLGSMVVVISPVLGLRRRTNLS